ncbi:MAG: BrnT family toxin [SAR324 cluster bacterium]|nr:BrnT family toxin [SAR324 cluster bacterium]
MQFEWDTQKAESNVAKHEISFHEAGTVLSDPLALTFEDPDFMSGEYRYITFGLSRLNNYIVISHVDRDNKIRIISARRMTKKERKIYEEG